MENPQALQKPEYEFLGKYVITADIRLETPLHIGGTEEDFEIGGMDNPVVKDPMTGLPYIPGSSLKGKMRSLLEWAHHLLDFEPKNPKNKEWIAILKNPQHDVSIAFGLPAEGHQVEQPPGPTRLTVRDAYPQDGKNGQKGQKEKWEDAMGENVFTEMKMENSIDRLTSKANPRPMERVPRDSVFAMECIFDVYEEADRNRLKCLFEGMVLLEDSFLGGGGSRGSGQVKFTGLQITLKSREYYMDPDKNPPQQIDLHGHKTAEAIWKNFSKLTLKP